MDLIERYIHAIKKKLPVDKREAAEKEVRNLIKEKLVKRSAEQKPEEIEVEEILREMGEPGTLAEKYHPQKKYLIGPDFFDTYLLVLKIVAAVVFFGLSLALGIGYIFSPPANFWVGIGNYFSGIFSGVIQAAAWVTLFFALFERLGGEKIEFRKEKDWRPSQLPPVNGKTAYIKISEPILGIIFISLVMVLFNAGERVVGVYTWGEEPSIILLPFFNHDVFRQFLPLFNLFFLLAIIKEGWKFFTRKWTLPLAGFNGLLNVSFIILFIFVLTRPDIWNKDFIGLFTRNGDLNGEILDIMFRNIPRFFLGIFSLGLIIDTVTSFYKAFKGLGSRK